LKGKIIKGIAGFYYIHVSEVDIVYECKAKGIFRKQKVKPLVGDDVEITIEDQPKGKGVITDIRSRQNELLRPAVANVDQALVLFAAAEPEPNLNLLDRFLIMMQKQNINTIVCFNKKDIVTEKEILLLKDAYRRCGCEVICTSMLEEDMLSRIYEHIKGKTTVLAGPSGVGKSSLINRVQPNAAMETGSVSDKIKRGRHTTRHSELVYIDKNTYIMDTPGFSSLYVQEIEKEELKDYYFEFKEYEDACRFQGCMHINEPGCAVKKALEEEKISKIRYKNYVLLYNEQKNRRKY
jgi:ribosome biogenesis GTPase